MSGADQNEDVGGSAESLATTRSRRNPSRARGVRSEALARLKAAKKKEWKYTVDEEMRDNVYDVVDEKKYAEVVRDRLDDDFIVDDDGEYADDGREIFDDDINDEDRGKYTGPRKGVGKKRDKNDDDGSNNRTKRNIKNMLLSMPGKKRKDDNSASNLKDDDILESLLSEIKPGTKKSGADVAAETKTRAHAKRPMVTFHSMQHKVATSSVVNPFAKRQHTGIKKIDKINETLDEPDTVFSESVMGDGDSATQTIEEFDEAKVNVPLDDHFVDESFSQPSVKDEDVREENRGFFQKEGRTSKPDLADWNENGFSAAVTNESAPKPVEVQLEQGKLPLVTDKKGDKVLRMFWLDAYEDPFKHPGTIWLFGKVYVEPAKAYVSCCVTVKNIKRQVFLLKRQHRFDFRTQKEIEDQEELTVNDVYAEFNSKIAERNRIAEFRSRHVEKLYCFEHRDVPTKAQYLEVQYSAKYPALPIELNGETFSRVFGSNKSSLESFLISRKIKGPGWIDIKCPASSNPAISWCKVEAVCEDPSNVIVNNADGGSPPPLTIMAMNMKTTINPRSMLNEINVVSCLVHQNFCLDKAAPKQPFQAHFCALTRPADEVWPFDLHKMIAQTGNALRIEKLDSERALLGFLLAKIVKIDPDIIIGHDITGFDLDVLLHRTVMNKIPHWSRLGRLKRSQAPHFRGKVPEKESVTGRLVCDLKISAKELIRCKSYEIGALAEKILGKPVESRIEVGCDDMRKAYESSKALLHVVNLSLQDAADTLQCIYELNALPLALQITQVAGNVMSRTLLGGRAERNEFLLLHAFSEKNYICPDKQYSSLNKRRSLVPDDDEDVQHQQEAKKAGRRKPAYAGGLVLEPKRGFYDKFILLMDFNSLYPSIIQEYNICFTTVNRKLPLDENGKPDEDHIPDLPDPDCDPGILPMEIRKLVESRKSVKQLLKDPNLTPDQRSQYDIRQKALKLTANSMYGCLGFSHSRFFAKPLAALITSRGREILLQTKNVVEKMNLEVIYGDTDSIMINTNSVDFAEVFRLGTSIKQEVNKMYKLLELDVDGVYRYMLLLKKKKYAAITMEQKANGAVVQTTELKGLDIVRRDWSQLASNAGKAILEHILSDCTPDERVAFIHNKMEQLATDLKAGRIPLSDLAITKQLTKSPNDYADKKSLPHVQVAVRVNSKSGGKKLKSGDTIEYVICDDGSNLPATQRAYHVDEIKERQELKVDIQYYLAQQVHPVVSRLCDPLEGTDSARLAQCLGLDPEQYRRSMANESAHNKHDDNEIRVEDRFRECQKLKVSCECGEEITLEGVTRGSKEERHLALARCPNIKQKCNKRPIDRVARIQNKLTRNIRQHIRRFYQGYVVCEDPACTGRTRLLPLDFKGAFPVCSTCEKANMTKEYSDKQLYHQLLYYQQLFDVAKASSRYGRNFNLDLMDITDGQRNYMILKQHLDRLMDQNKYSIIDMTRLFGGFYLMKAAKFRVSKHY